MRLHGTLGRGLALNSIICYTVEYLLELSVFKTHLGQLIQLVVNKEKHLDEG